MGDLQVRFRQHGVYRATDTDDVARDVLKESAATVDACDDDARAADDAPPAWLAFGLGLAVVVGMTAAAYLIAEMFEALGFTG